MTTSPEEANKSYQDFKALQQEWKEIKNIPADTANEVWKNYQLYVCLLYTSCRNEHGDNQGNGKSVMDVFHTVD